MSKKDSSREMLRHTLATLAYRAAKALREAPESFAAYGSENGRSPAIILAHMGDLMEWALSMANGKKQWHNSKPLRWQEENERFFKAMKSLDEYLASEAPLNSSVEKLFQGPIADALTHTGQIAMLRRLAGCPIRGENYFRAAIAVGRVGADQATPAQEF